MISLWSKDIEEKFFRESFKFASPEQLFYVADDNRYLAYWPKNYKGEKSTLQSRNSLIGQFTEKWTADLLKEIIKGTGLYSVQGAKCDELALSEMSPADVVISKRNSVIQKPEDILVIIEVKMSIVWNWELKNKRNLTCIGDYKTHKGNPGLLRSDSMLKAIGKSINIRVSSPKASTIPIVVIGNTPIAESYFTKVDHLKVAGIVQGFWSVNPMPLDGGKENIKNTLTEGFHRFDNTDELKKYLESILAEERNFFSSMKSKKELGRIIEIANKEKDYERKAEVFLGLLKKEC